MNNCWEVERKTSISNESGFMDLDRIKLTCEMDFRVRMKVVRQMNFFWGGRRRGQGFIPKVPLCGLTWCVEGHCTVGCTTQQSERGGELESWQKLHCSCIMLLSIYFTFTPFSYYIVKRKIRSMNYTIESIKSLILPSLFNLAFSFLRAFFAARRISLKEDSSS